MSGPDDSELWIKCAAMADSIAEVLDGEDFATSPALCVLGDLVGKFLCRVHIDQRAAVTEAWINGLRDGMKGKT